MKYSMFYLLIFMFAGCKQNTNVQKEAPKQSNLSQINSLEEQLHM